MDEVTNPSTSRLLLLRSARARKMSLSHCCQTLDMKSLISLLLSLLFYNPKANCVDRFSLLCKHKTHRQNCIRHRCRKMALRPIHTTLVINNTFHSLRTVHKQDLLLSFGLGIIHNVRVRDMFFLGLR
jgi:hypothetical protein